MSIPNTQIPIINATFEYFKGNENIPKKIRMPYKCHIFEGICQIFQLAPVPQQYVK
jgi:hypothetical protein